MVKSIESCEFKSMNFVPVYLTIDTLKTDLIKKKKRGGGWKIDYRLNDSIYFLVTETNPYGTLFFANESTEEYELVPPDTKSSKEPTESGYSNPSSPVGTVHEEGSGPDQFYSDNSDVTLDEEPKVPLPGSTHGTHVTMELTKDSSAHSQAELSEINAASNPSAQQLSFEKQMAFLQQILAMKGYVSGTNPFPNPGQQSQNYMPNSQTDWSQEFGCYHKAGYSVVVTNGQLTESTHDKGMVMMESGTQFCIVVGNENDHGRW